MLVDVLALRAVAIFRRHSREGGSREAPAWDWDVADVMANDALRGCDAVGASDLAAPLANALRHQAFRAIPSWLPTPPSSSASVLAGCVASMAAVDSALTEAALPSRSSLVPPSEGAGVKAAEKAVAMRQRASRRWLLVRAFRKQHTVISESSSESSETLLGRLAEAGDWPGFLEQASAEGVEARSEQFVRASRGLMPATLRRHVLRGVDAIERSTDVDDDDDDDSDSPGDSDELFFLLGREEDGKGSSRLRLAARRLNWPLLYVAADTETEDEPLVRLADWLEATLRLASTEADNDDGDEPPPSTGEENKPGWPRGGTRAVLAAARLIARGCSAAARRGTSLFAPPWSHVKASGGSRVAESELYEAFALAVTSADEMARHRWRRATMNVTELARVVDEKRRNSKIPAGASAWVHWLRDCVLHASVQACGDVAAALVTSYAVPPSRDDGDSNDEGQEAELPDASNGHEPFTPPPQRRQSDVTALSLRAEALALLERAFGAEAISQVLRASHEEASRLTDLIPSTVPVESSSLEAVLDPTWTDAFRKQASAASAAARGLELLLDAASAFDREDASATAHACRRSADILLKHVVAMFA